MEATWHVRRRIITGPASRVAGPSVRCCDPDRTASQNRQSFHRMRLKAIARLAFISKDIAIGEFSNRIVHFPQLVLENAGEVLCGQRVFGLGIASRNTVSACYYSTSPNKIRRSFAWRRSAGDDVNRSNSVQSWRLSSVFKFDNNSRMTSELRQWNHRSAPDGYPCALTCDHGLSSQFDALLREFDALPRQLVSAVGIVSLESSAESRGNAQEKPATLSCATAS